MSQENLNACLHDHTPHLLTAAGTRLALFLALQQDPDVMRFVAQDRPWPKSVKRSILV
jgi:hypothetical protein